MTQIFGHEFLLAAKYRSFAIANLPATRCGKVFLKEAGDALPVLVGWAKKGVHPVLAAQGLWRGGAHDYSGQRILAEGLRELNRFRQVARDFPHLKFEYSIFCEHKLKRDYLRTVFKAQWEYIHDLPNITLVNTPMPGGDIVKPSDVGIPAERFKNELHGTWSPNLSGTGNYNWACDGLTAIDCNIQGYKDRHRKADIIWMWIQQYNLKAKVTDATPIERRRVRPVTKQVVSVDHLCSPKGEVRFRSDSLYKSHGDQHGSKPVGREQKPVVITPVNKSSIKVLDSNDRVIASIPRTSTYGDGRPLYRLDMWGFELQNKAVQSSGSPIVELANFTGTGRNKKKVSYGTVNPAFRENAWRTTVQPEGEEQHLIFDDDKVDPDWV